MNWGKIVGYVLVGMCAAASIGYAFVHDWRRALYFLFCAAINLTVIY